MAKKKTNSKNPKKLSPFQMGIGAQPPDYAIGKKVQAILDDPELDSNGLTLKDRAVLVLELGKRLVADEHADFHEHYLRHATPLAEASRKDSRWVFEALAEAIDDATYEHGDVWYPALPFLLSGDTETVEEAAKLMCLYHPGDGKSVLIGSESVLESMINRASRLNEHKGKARQDASAAIAAGIAAVLFCGDLRLLPALNKAWDQAGDDVREVLYQYFDSRITELQVELYLGILERTKPGSDDFERAALHLSSCVSPSCMPHPRDKVTIDRISFDFGLHEDDGDEGVTVVAQTPARKYLAKIEPRLLALQLRSPKLIRDILDSWQKA